MEFFPIIIDHEMNGPTRINEKEKIINRVTKSWNLKIWNLPM